MRPDPVAGDGRRPGTAVLLYAPIPGDTQALQALLGGEGLDAIVCANADDFYARLDAVILLAIVTEEGLAACDAGLLEARLQRQPPWSDLPLLALTGSDGVGIDRDRFARLAGIGNVTLLERPTSRQVLLMAIHAALRARRLQYAVRDHWRDLERHAARLEAAVEERTLSLQHEVQERRRVEAALAEARRLESLGRLTGGVAHDFNNLLQVVAGSEALIRMLLAKAPDQRVDRALDSIRRAAGHGAALTQQLLAYARRQPLASVALELQAHLHATVDLVQRSLDPAVDLELKLSAGLWPVLADPAQLDAAILNLVGNACDAMPAGGTLLLAARNVVLPSATLPEADQLAGDYVCLTLTDSGGGMSEEIARQAFEPFFTTKPVGKGTGLGLSQVYGFAIQSQGQAFIRRERQGTTVGLVLPRSRAALPALPATAGKEMPASLAGLRILCVEDDAAVAEITVALLEGLGAAVALADSADDAMEADFGAVDLVLSDIMMPGSMDGIGLARWLGNHHPGLPVVLCSGYMVEPERLQSLPVEFVRKPYRLASLSDAIVRALEKGGRKDALAGRMPLGTPD